MRFFYVYNTFLIEILNCVSHKEYITVIIIKTCFLFSLGDEGENSGPVTSGIYPGITGIIFESLTKGV